MGFYPQTQATNYIVLKEKLERVEVNGTIAKHSSSFSNKSKKKPIDFDAIIRDRGLDIDYISDLIQK